MEALKPDNREKVDDDNNKVSPTKVLAIASHVSYGYVGNTMAAFVMQSLGIEVAAINTVHFSNHTGYKSFKGTRTPASEIKNLYDGLKDSYLTDFDVLLSGYIPSLETLEIVGQIAEDLRHHSKSRPGGFFWVLDPVMGDQGKLYVSEELVEGYKRMIPKADLILPNQFEVQILTGINIGTDTEGAELRDVAKAIGVLHKQQGLRHVIVTSVRVKGKEDVLCVVGSSAKTNGDSRLFVVEVPVLDCFFSGTGDMFAALMVGRLRQTGLEGRTLIREGWTSPDNVPSTDLPLAIATCQVLSSMQMILEKTIIARDEEISDWAKNFKNNADADASNHQSIDFSTQEYLAMTKAAEVRVVRNANDLRNPEDRYRPRPLEG